MLFILLLLLTLLTKIVAVYYGFLALSALKKPKPIPKSPPKTRFACLIAARNEEAVIERSVSALLRQDYPQELFDVFVIPNNCTDRTSEIACAAGAQILTCRRPVHNKGEALGEAFDILLTRPYDAFCVFDADNEADAAYLRHMNDAVCAGANAAKARVIGREPKRSAVSGCYAVYHSIFNHLFDRGRENLGISAHLVGTGFLLSRSALEALGGWHTETMTEDAELAAKCAEAGVHIRYVPEAVTVDEAPDSFRLSLRQRHRWCAGIQVCARRYFYSLLRQFFRSRLAADEFLTLLAPFCQILGVFLTPLTILCGRVEFLPFLLSTVFSYLGTGVLGSLVLLLRRGFRWRTAFLFPLFMLSWLPLQVAALLSPPKTWKAIPHGSRKLSKERV